VLSIRRQVFPEPIVPDDVYEACWYKNNYTMKVVLDPEGAAVGYWSLIPITRESFDRFIAGKCAHRDMLENHCVPWDHTDRTALFVYIVGVVVPGSISHAYRTMLDLFSFSRTLLGLATVWGICGYPHTKEGDVHFKRQGFNDHKQKAPGEKDYPIYSVQGNDAACLCRRLGAYAHGDTFLDKRPEWNPEDYAHFVGLFPSD